MFPGSYILVADESNQTPCDLHHRTVLPLNKRYRFHANYPIDGEENYMAHLCI